MTSPRPISLVLGITLCMGLCGDNPWSGRRAVARAQGGEGAVDTAPTSAGTTPAEDALFAVRFTTGPSWDASKPFGEQRYSAEHSANLRRMRAAGLIVLGGRFADTGMIVVRALDEVAVRAQLARDPSIEAGTFRVAVDAYRPFFSHSRPPADAAESAETAIIRDAIAAFNAHDASAFAALCAEDVTWFGVAADSQSVDGEGRESIRSWLAGYFESLPDVRSEVSGLTQTGSRVAFRERTTWTADDGTPRAQSALGVYEIQDGKIRRAWYFPAHRETPSAVEPAAPR